MQLRYVTMPASVRVHLEFHTTDIFMEASSCRHDQLLTLISSLSPSLENNSEAEKKFLIMTLFS